MDTDLNANLNANLNENANIEKKKTICLNMIVKNESEIILDTLKNLCSYIPFDYWVISDTGSTDTTKEIICAFFKERNIAGELVEHEWQDFAYNRTKALECAFNKTDYLLIFDADDSIQGNFVLSNMLDLGLDSYNLRFGKDVTYLRPLIINNRKKWCFKGVLHEFLSAMEDNINGVVGTVGGDYYLISGRHGNRSKNPNKYIDDARVFVKAVDKEMSEENGGDKGLICRYTFYCAQSYKDAGPSYFLDAIEWYKKVLVMNNWVQEKYYACLMIGNLYHLLQDSDNAIKYWIYTSEYDMERIEGVVYAMEGLRNNGNHTMVNMLYHKFKHYNKNMGNDKLFVDKTKYKDLIEYNASICSYYVVGEKKTGYECCKKILQNNIIGESLMKSTLSNIQFYKEYMRMDSDKTLYNKIILKISEPIILNTQFSKHLCKASKNILFYTGFSYSDWNFSYMKNNALGGSEKAVAYLSSYFPKEYRIFVSGGVEYEQLDNVTYIHNNQLQDLIKVTAFHTIICSRYLGFLEMFTDLNFYQFYIWGHDCVFKGSNDLSDKQIISKWNNYIDGCVCQTNWHAIEFKRLYPELEDKIITINNGIDIRLFDREVDGESKRIKNRFIYSSCTERGLKTIVEMWPRILDILPDATLIVSSYNDFPSRSDEVELKKRMDPYPDSIQHLGKLNSNQLYNEMRRSEYWLYPTCFLETSCITSMEMLASGVICIYYPVAGLVDTIQHYGIPVKDQNEIIEKLTELSKDEERKMELRKNGIQYSLSCSYENRVEEWIQLLGL